MNLGDAGSESGMTNLMIIVFFKHPFWAVSMHRVLIHKNLFSLILVIFLLWTDN